MQGIFRVYSLRWTPWFPSLPTTLHISHADTRTLAHPETPFPDPPPEAHQSPAAGLQGSRSPLWTHRTAHAASSPRASPELLVSGPPAPRDSEARRAETTCLGCQSRTKLAEPNPTPSCRTPLRAKRKHFCVSPRCSGQYWLEPQSSAGELHSPRPAPRLTLRYRPVSRGCVLAKLQFLCI